MKIWNGLVHGVSVNFFVIVLLFLGRPGGIFSAAQVFAAEDVFDLLQVNQFTEQVEAPDFSLPDVNGGELKLSDFRGKLVFLNFWATWCPYCRVERPALQALYMKYREQGFVVISVSIDRTALDTVQQYVKDHGITFPNVHDQSLKVASDYLVRGVPMTYFIDRQGNALGGVIGPREWDSQPGYDLVELLLMAPSQGKKLD